MLKILIVDDEAPIREWLLYCLNREAERYQVIGSAVTGRQAYEIALSEKPEVIITDIKMPVMNGLELMKLVKEVLPYTVFIILTNYADFAYAKQAISYGAKEYLLKSEMKSSDLMGILEQVEQKKVEIQSSKVADTLPSGHIDLYRLYQKEEHEGDNGRMLEALGMKDNLPYCMMCVEENLDYPQAAYLREYARQEGAQLQFTAYQKGYVYLVVQSGLEEEAYLSLERVARRVWSEKSCTVGIGTVFCLFRDFTEAVKQALAASSYGFFVGRSGIYDSRMLMQKPRLDYDLVRDSYHSIILQMSYKQYEEALPLIRKWFWQFEEISILDVSWAMERCRRMVQMVEEQYYRLNSSEEASHKSIAGAPALNSCLTACEEMILMLNDKKHGQHSDSIDYALVYIHQNYNQDISLVDVASRVYRSPEYFSRLFKEEVGEKFSTYLMMYRLKKAKELLIGTDMRVFEVSYAVGYSTASYFSRLYRKYMGKTPEEEKCQNSKKYHNNNLNK